MDNPDTAFSELVNSLKSWIPRRSEPANVSRDFWMPDHSCRVCYDCDSQFTIFNRRHHCRRCGRIFCGRCTANSVPVLADDSRDSREDVERIRVCNFCFKQWEQEIFAADKGSQASDSPSLSEMSFVSTKSNGTVNSSTTTAGSYSTGAYQHSSLGSAPSPHQSCHIKSFSYKKEHVSGRNGAAVPEKDASSSIQFGYLTNRSDDDGEEYAAFHDLQAQNLQHPDCYYSQVEFDELDAGYTSQIMNTVEENVTSLEICSPLDDTEFQDSLADHKLEDGAEPDNNYECDASSSIYAMEGTDTEPVDFENNGLLWLPPDPEDEDDEREPNLFDDDDDDEDATGDWDRLCSSHSFGSGEYRSRDRSSEEHKKAMKNVVDGHFRALIAQLLQVENISICEEGDKMCWLEIITSLSWEAANFLKPDMSKGGGMDPGGYVKVKCLACGHRSESMVVKGIVCKKNTAHRRMTSRIEKPRFLILGGALEYQRVTNLLSSIDTLLQQETDHLRMAVAKIVAHQPDILFVEKTVARYAQDLLLEKDISLVLNIKRPLLERIARCSGAQIAPSIDHLSSQKLGHCELFHVEKFFEHHESAGQGMKKMLKTLMFLEGCPKPLGCTVLLKGGTIDELKRVKHVIQYGIFAAYHLALETSFLADEGASLPELPLKSPITVALPDKPSSIDKSISTIPGFTLPAAGKQQASIDAQKPNISDSNLTSIRSTGVLAEVATSSSRSHSSSTAKSASASTDLFVDTNLNSFCPAKLSNSSPLYGTMKEKSKVFFGDFHETVLSISDGQAIAHDSVIPDSCHNCWTISESDGFMANGKHSESNNSDQEVDRKHENTLLKEEILTSSSDHQSILVSLSTRCVWKGTVCERSQLFRIKYYSNFDKPLGRFLRDHLFDQNYRCCSCDMPSEAHVHCYTHHQGSLTISVRKLPEFLLPGERDGKIWMWHRCLRCPRDNGFPPATQRVVMSDAAWGLSFGKFLELSFSNHAAASRVASCGHSLHRDCLRFYGFGKMVACFRYASIDVHSVYLPPHKLDFDHKNHEWIQKEANEVAERAELLFREIQNALYQIADKRTPKGSSEVSELGHYIVDLEGILQKEKSEFEDSMRKILKKELRMGQQIIDILEVNKLRRQLLFHSYLWDQRLIFASRPASSPQEVLNSSPQRDKDKNYSTENADKMSNPQTDIHGTDAVPEDLKTSNLRESINAVNSEEVFHDNHKSNLGQQGVNIELDSFQMKESNMSLHTSTSVSEQSVPLEYGLVARRTLSDGHFPNIPNLSYAFDAKWTGENGPLIANASMLDSSASVEAPASLALSEDSKEQNGAEVTHSFASVLLSKLGDSAEDISSWLGMPFVHFYRSLNKGWGGSHRFGALNEYTPVYVSLFRELERQGGPRFLLPVGVNDIVIAIYDDEPTSIISYALVSHEYHIQLSDNQERIRDVDASLLALNDSGVFLSSQSVDEISSDPYRNFGSNDDSILSLSGSRGSFAPDPLISTKAMHVRISFTDEGPLGKVKYTVTCYYAKHFDTLRRTCCPSEVDFVRSLSRCKKWGAQGGKSNVFFAKSLDDRFIIKQVTKTELESFIKFAPAYFKYLAESIGTRSPTCLAKILGIYQVTAKNLKGGKELKMDVLVMENLLFGRNVTRLYDLKGSSRSRYNPDSSGSNKVLLDQNLIETMPTSPIFVGNKAKRLLERAVWNDTSFLASIDVMDYSLLVGIDEEKHELVLGIIDFMRQYTWDKHLETWVKAAGMLGGPKNVSPTVISPKQYKKRFRKAMSAYFLVVPDQWSPPASMPSKSTAESGQDILQDSSGGS